MARSNQFIEIRIALPFCVLAMVCACYSPESPRGSPCADDSRCPKGQLCIAGICGGPEDVIDAAPQDAAVDSAPDAPPLACTVPGDCANTNPCVTMDCVSNECVPSVRPDGSSCDVAAAARCCGGSCVNIANDENNCGGCGQQCAVGRTCQGVGSTTDCNIKPEATSGRCTCAGASSECPDGQVCRTQNPYANRCSPEGEGDCAAGQVFVDVSLCPNFCRYP